MGISAATPGIRTPAASRRGWLGLGGLLLTGSLVALASANTEALLPESIRPAPAGLAGPFGGTGVDLHVAGTIAVLVLMFAAYAVVVGADGLSARAVLGTIAFLHLCVLLAPPLVSTDVFSYQAYARMGAEYGVNPYTSGPVAIRLDAVFPYVGAKWSSMPSAYGPVFTAGSYLLAPLTVAASAVAYKSIAAVASLLLVAIVWRCARLRGSDPVRAAALVGLNPLLVVYGVGGGHNDLLMLLALAGSIWALLASREATGGALAMLAIGLKLTGGLLLPFALVDRGAGRGPRSRRSLLTGCLVGVAAIAALSFGLFGDGALHLLATVGQSQREGDWLSIPGAIRERLGSAAAGRIAGDVLLAAFLLVCLRLLTAVWRGALDWIDGAGWATLAMLVASSSLLPWYVGWALPLAALGRGRRLRVTAVTITGIVQGIELLGVIPHG